MFGAESLLAAALSFATAVCFAAGYVLQYHEAHSVPDRFFLSPKMLVELARHRIWVAGILVMFIGSGLQAGALAIGSLAIVEPILTTALLFALPLSAAWRRERLTRRDWYGAIAVCIGLALLLGVGEPTAGKTTMAEHQWVLVTLATWAGALILIAAGRRSPSPSARASLIGGAAGILFGLQDAMTRYTMHAMTHHQIGSLLVDWKPMVSVVTGIYGIALMQSAYKAGPLTAGLPTIAVGEPVAGMLIGVFALDEHLNASAAAVTFEIIGAIIMVAGTWTLARSQLVCGAQHPSRLKQLESQIEARLKPVKERVPGRGQVPARAQLRYSAVQVLSMFLIFRRGR
jgi:drug/metabolite transporter (DMT)-like permease